MRYPEREPPNPLNVVDTPEQPDFRSIDGAASVTEMMDRDGQVSGYLGSASSNSDPGFNTLAQVNLARRRDAEPSPEMQQVQERISRLEEVQSLPNQRERDLEMLLESALIALQRTSSPEGQPDSLLWRLTRRLAPTVLDSAISNTAALPRSSSKFCNYHGSGVGGGGQPENWDKLFDAGLTTGNSQSRPSGNFEDPFSLALMDTP
jgi:hypothetical protein